MKREEYGETRRSAKHRRMVFVVFSILLKHVKEKENSQLLTTNDSTNTLTSY